MNSQSTPTKPPSSQRRRYFGARGATTVDFVVCGLGVIGSAVVDAIARRGYSVVGLERHRLSHQLGGSTGGTRGFKRAISDPAHAELVARSESAWLELQAESGQELYLQTGALLLAPAGHEVIANEVHGLAAQGLPFDELSMSQVEERFAAVRLPEGYRGLFEHRAGVLLAERCNEAFRARAIRAGATLASEEQVRSITASEFGATVVTERASYHCAGAVVALGAWLTALAEGSSGLLGYRPPLKLERQVQAWFKAPPNVPAFSAAELPIFHTLLPKGGVIYGMPRIDDRGVKLARLGDGESVRIAELTRIARAAELHELSRFARSWFPSLGTTTYEQKVCVNVNTPDRRYLLGLHPEYRTLCIAGGFSGHGYKLAPALGDAIAELVIDGRAQSTIAGFRLDRFEA